ncbi:response regulator [Spirochaeta cellobiosiphila]|uniref:response regulator n=1 Tax=Spirochaeta cellobiosiphila TaxID=504483 RepID=UPI000417F04B|nr:response regulator [Spirochaeta cellobiosiphila]
MVVVDERQNLEILLIDDDQGDIFFLEETLSEIPNYSFKVQSADSLSSGLQILQSAPIQLVFLDLLLPDSQNLTSIKKIREISDDIPIIVTTGMDNLSLSMTAMDEGAQFYLVKDKINVELLLQSITFALNAKETYLNSRLNNQIKHLMDQSLDGQLVVGHDKRIAYMNPAATNISLQADINFDTLIEEIKNKTVDNQLEVLNHYGDNHIYELKEDNIVWDGADATMYSLRDVTEHIQQKRQLAEALDMNKKLLRELKHRVINSFTLLSSMVSIMMTDKNSAEANSPLAEIEKRIDAMAELYHIVYISDDITSMSLYLYMDNLTKHMTEDRVQLTNHTEDINISSAKALLLGLIFVELFTNSVKHGFPDGQKGHIHINITQQDDNVHILYKDDGIGLPEDFNPEESDSYGMTVISGLTKQLEGEHQMYNDKGLTFKMSFPLQTD